MYENKFSQAFNQNNKVQQFYSCLIQLIPISVFVEQILHSFRFVEISDKLFNCSRSFWRLSNERVE